VNVSRPLAEVEEDLTKCKACCWY